MALQFNADISTTIAEVDNQYQELFKRVDSLQTALRGEGKLIKTIQFLTDCVVFHFDSEEKCMDTRSYLDRTQHKAQHTQFVKTFQRMRDCFFEEGINAQATEDTKQPVEDWLINQI